MVKDKSRILRGGKSIYAGQTSGQPASGGRLFAVCLRKFRPDARLAGACGMMQRRVVRYFGCLREGQTELFWESGMTSMRALKAVFVALVLMSGFAGCSFLPRQTPQPLPHPQVSAGGGNELAALGYAIQAGAFVKLDNAVRLMQKLDSLGLDAYYFRHASGLYKVRFGNFPSRKEAEIRANKLKGEGLIEEFYIVAPEDSPAARFRRYHPGTLRKMLVGTAEGFLGIRYEWGGESAETGFDCSGLTMTVYKLNGLNLPRHSRAQYEAGSQVDRENLSPGDLVFFATNGDGTVSHVGLYIGNDRFIHAPKKGESIRRSSLASSYYARNYVGGRSYLGRED